MIYYSLISYICSTKYSPYLRLRHGSNFRFFGFDISEYLFSIIKSAKTVEYSKNLGFFHTYSKKNSRLSLKSIPPPVSKLTL